MLGAACGPDQAPCASTSEIRICADGATVRGIDVSTYQSTVDWAQVKSAGMSFAFARISDGLSSIDAQFGANWPAMKAAGLVRGSYQFFRASKDATAQADLVIDRLAMFGGLGAGDLPPVLDLELTDGVSDSVVVAAAQTWLDRIESRLGRRAIVYTGNNLATTTMMHFSSYPLWVPNYTTMCPMVPDGWTRWAFWQNSSSGTVSGVSGSVDTDYFNGDDAALAAFIAQSNVNGTSDMGSSSDGGGGGEDMARSRPDLAVIGPCAQ